jgi:hypothetical protein
MRKLGNDPKSWGRRKVPMAKEREVEEDEVEEGCPLNP